MNETNDLVAEYKIKATKYFLARNYKKSIKYLTKSIEILLYNSKSSFIDKIQNSQTAESISDCSSSCPSEEKSFIFSQTSDPALSESTESACAEINQTNTKWLSTLYCNRSACYLAIAIKKIKKKRPCVFSITEICNYNNTTSEKIAALISNAVSDALTVISLENNSSDKTHYKAYLRIAEAYILQNEWSKAFESYAKAHSCPSFPRKTQFYIEDKMNICKLCIATRDSQFYLSAFQPGKNICMKRKSSWNPFSSLLTNFVSRGMRNVMYCIGGYNINREQDEDGMIGECIVVDPCWDVEELIETVETLHRMRIVGVFLTHNHFDHVGGRPPYPYSYAPINVQGIKYFLKILDRKRRLSKSKNYKKIEIPVYIGEGDVEKLVKDTRIAFTRIMPVTERISLNIANINLEIIPTPGHTPGSSMLFYKTPSGLSMLFTGDSIFPGSCGRVDLEGGSPRKLYESLQMISQTFKNDSKLTLLFPGHSYCGKEISTLEREKSFGMLREMSFAEFLSVFI